MISFNPNYLLKALSNTVTLEFRASTYDFAGNTIQSKAVVVVSSDKE